MMTRAPRQDTLAASAARGALPTSAPSTPTVAVSADIIPNCERGNQFAAIFRAPVKVTVAPRPTSRRPAKRTAGLAASPMASEPTPMTAPPPAITQRGPTLSISTPARDHEARVGVEVRRGEQAHHRAGDAERLHQLLGDHAGRRAVQEGDEEDEGGDAPHEPPSARRDRGIGRGHAPRVQKPAGSHARTMASSAAVGRRRRRHVGRGREGEPGGGPHALHALARDDRRRATSRSVAGSKRKTPSVVTTAAGPPPREPDPRAPARAVAEAGRGDVVHALAEAVPLLRHDHHEAPGQARDVGAAAAAGQPHLRPAPVADVGRVQVAEPVDLGAADEAQVHEPLLEQRHDLERARAPERARDVRRVAHGHQRLGRRLIAHDAVLEEADGPGRVRALGEGERDQGQAHADEDHARRRGSRAPAAMTISSRSVNGHGRAHRQRRRAAPPPATYGWRRMASSLISTPRPGPVGTSTQPSRACDRAGPGRASRARRSGTRPAWSRRTSRPRAGWRRARGRSRTSAARSAGSRPGPARRSSGTRRCRRPW